MSDIQSADFEIMDSHHHLWELERGDYNWLSSKRPIIFKNFTINDLSPELAAAGIKKTIVVQATPSDDETDYLLAIARNSSVLRGVVGWVDFEHPTACERIDYLASCPKLVGIRPMIQAIPDVNWMLRSDIEPALRMMERLDLPFDALVTPQHLSALKSFAKRFSSLRIVINHFGKPEMSENLTQWKEEMAELAELSNVWCKFSGLTAKAPTPVNVDVLRPVFDFIIDCFGMHRLMWASDWPVLLETASYSNWMDLSREYLQNFSKEEQAQIFGKTAQDFYRIELL
ncbi:amidohydrolase family protein [Ahrensia kielensis]|uniref:Amidohydrolase family protein n=1 Tax=Ahrensia kielensis TaxID=76980 RepID=A0ABU9TA04_9HYPH